MSKTETAVAILNDDSDLTELAEAAVANLPLSKPTSDSPDLPAFEGEISPYKAMQKVNAFLKELGVDKVLPGPMFYTYCKKQYIKNEGMQVSHANLNTWWTEKYFPKNIRPLISK